MRRILATAWVALALLAGCGLRKNHADPAETFRKLMAREVEPLSVREATAADGGVKVRVEAADAPKLVRAPGDPPAYTLTIPFAEKSTIFCSIQHAPANPAIAIQTVLGQVGREHHILLLDAGVLADRPSLYVEAQFPVGGVDTASFMLVKVAAALLEPGLVVCWHADPGFRNTFRRILDGLVGSINFPAEPDWKPAYREVSVHVGNGVRYGIRSLIFDVRPDGTRLLTTADFMFLPHVGSEPTPAYNVYWERSDAFGVVEWSRQQAEGAEDKGSEWTLERDAHGTYSVQGTYRGRTLDGPVRAPDLPHDLYSATTSVRSLLDGAGGDRRLVLSVYDPETDPRAITSATLRTTGAETGDGIPVESQHGSWRECLLIDASGRPTRRWDCDHPEMLVERLVAKGSL